MKKHVYFVTSNLANGGAERVTAVLANALCDHHYTVSMVFMKDGKTFYHLDKGICKEMLFGIGGRFNRVFGKIFRLRRLMQKDPQGTFVAMLPFESFYLFLAGLGLKNKMIFSLRNDPRHMNRMIEIIVKRIIYRFADFIVFQTEDAKAFFPKTIQKKGVIIENPISEGLPEIYMGERKKEFVSVGRLTQQKNYPMLLRAFADFLEVYPDWKLKIYGEGQLKDYLINLSVQLGIDRAVFFCGYSDSVIEAINQSAAFILSSDYEGISNAMLEALCTGVPCICTDCPAGGAKQYIKDGKNGFLIPVNDCGALTNRMLSIVKKTLDKEILAKKAHELREHLFSKNIVRQWEKII